MELIIVFKKENPGQFVRAQNCMSDWEGEGSTKILCFYQEIGSCMDLLRLGSRGSDRIALAWRRAESDPVWRRRHAQSQEVGSSSVQSTVLLRAD